MQIQDIQEYCGKTVDIKVNDKNINGILIEIKENHAFVETDYGLLQIEISKIQDIQKIKLLQDLFVYVCKNEICHCKGIRFITSKNKLDWPCKYFKKFNCPISKICNFNELPLKIKNRFMDGMHSQIPPFQKQS